MKASTIVAIILATGAVVIGTLMMLSKKRKNKCSCVDAECDLEGLDIEDDDDLDDICDSACECVDELKDAVADVADAIAD